MKLSFLNFILDLFFPKKCLGCNKAGVYICDKCLNKFETVPVPYSDPLIKELIKLFKYHYIKELAKPLAKLLIAQCGTYDVPHKTIVIPVPLHKRRLKERGFNQAELLAEQVAEHFSLPLENKVLKRKRYTKPQAKITNNKIRKEALKDAFEIAPEFVKKCLAANENLLKDKTVLLIDDVATTGATLSEAANVLKRAGAKEIWGLVIAKG